MITKKLKGFTIIELLIIIAIIGILAVVAVFNLTPAREKAYDMKRSFDLNRIRLAVDLYIDQYNVPPSSLADLSPEFMKKIPKDPQTEQEYAYSMTGLDWEVNANLLHNDFQEANDGGDDDTIYEVGTLLTLIGSGAGSGSTAHCSDGQLSGDETDVDCGGSCVTCGSIYSGLVSWWHFDENTGSVVVDNIGNNNGNITGSVWTTAGIDNSAISFNDDPDGINVIDHSSLDITSDISLEAWVYPTSNTQNYQYILMKGSDGDRVYGLMIEDDDIRFFLNGWGGGANNLRVNNQINTNQWYHLVGTYDGAELKLYKDSVLIGTSSYTNLINTNDFNVHISCRGSNNDVNHTLCFNGKIDEPAIWNKALTQAEITDRYNANKPALPAYSEYPDGTDFSAESDLTAVDNLILQNTNGSIEFPIGYNVNANAEDYDSNIEIGNGFVSVNKDALDDSFNNTTDVTINNVTCPATIYYANGVYGDSTSIVNNGQVCDGSTDPSCVNISCVGTTLTFTVSHFSSFAINEEEEDDTGGLISHWNFNENSGTTANDSVSTNHGTINGATWVDGVEGSGLSFDGEGDYVDLGKILAFEKTDNFSISFWYKGEDSGFIISKKNANNGTGYEIEIGKDQYYTVPVALKSNNDEKIRIIGRTDNGVTLIDNIWHNVVISYDGSGIASGIKMYIDGQKINQQVSDDDLGDTMVDSDEPLTLMARRWNSSYINGHKGILDEVKIYNKELTAQEILAEYEKKKPAENSAPMAVDDSIDKSTIPGENIDTTNIIDVTSTDRVDGTSENDEIHGSDINNSSGGIGVGGDQIYAGAGDDVVYGGAGNDTINAYANGSNYLDGGDSHDTIVGGWGDGDVLVGGAGNDILNGVGASDIDVVLYAGNRADYEITDPTSGWKSSSIQVKDIRDGSPDGTDYIQQQYTEKIQFADGTYDITDGEFQERIFVYENQNVITTNEDSSITIDVLANDTDVDGDTLSVTEIQGQDVTNNGDAVNVIGSNDNILGTAQVVDGEIQFNPTGTLQNLNDGENQDVIFEYTISDGQGGTDTASVTVNVTGSDDMPVINGTSGDDVIMWGTNDQEIINGLEGNDYIIAKDGDDVINGGDGNDIIRGMGGADTIDGGEGNDFISYRDSTEGVNVNLASGTGTGGDAEGDRISNVETVEGTNHNDTLTGTDGNDGFWGMSGDDVIAGGAGNDLVVGSEGTDTAVFSGNYSDYTFENVVRADGLSEVRVTDNRDGSPDGTDRVIAVENLQFADGTYDVASGEFIQKNGIEVQYWDNTGGVKLDEIRKLASFPDSPDRELNIYNFEIPYNTADTYATRVQALLNIKESGNYIFYIASDDNGELWLSDDDKEANKKLISQVPGWTSFRVFDKYSEQKSVEIYLEAGKKYYIEAMQQEGWGGDHMTVAWQKPDSKTIDVITGNYLSQYK